MSESRLDRLERLLGEAEPVVIVVTYAGEDGEELAPTTQEVEAARQRAIEEGLPYIVVFPTSDQG